jgi:hypothetical protein
MSDEKPNNIGMKPPHSGDFIRTEILDARPAPLKFRGCAGPPCRT